MVHSYPALHTTKIPNFTHPPTATLTSQRMPPKQYPVLHKTIAKENVWVFYTEIETNAVLSCLENSIIQPKNIHTHTHISLHILKTHFSNVVSR